MGVKKYAREGRLSDVKAGSFTQHLTQEGGSSVDRSKLMQKGRAEGQGADAGQTLE